MVRRFILAGVTVPAGLTWLLFALPADAQITCDPRIISIAQEQEHGYRDRGDRCEGTFKPEVTTEALRVVALYRTLEEFVPVANGTLEIGWPSAADSELLGEGSELMLQAQSLKLQEYYRMDTQRLIGAGSYFWPMGLLAARGLTSGDIGLRAFAWVGAEALYVPLTIGQQYRGVEEDQYTLTLVPNAQLTEVRISIAPVARPGELPRPDVRYYTVAERRLDQEIYITQRPFSIPIDRREDLGDRGVYVVEINATMVGGEPLGTKRVWFYHVGD